MVKENEESGWLDKQIKTSLKFIKEMKESQPHMFTEYVEMEHARQELEAAQRKFDEKKKAWDNLGCNI